MKQIEVTTRVLNTLEEIKQIMKKHNFSLIRCSRIEDTYLCMEELNDIENIKDMLTKSVLVRYLNVNNEEEFKKITYKNKEYDGNIVISEEKINVSIDNIQKAIMLFEAIGFKKLVNVNYDAIVYSNGEVELCFQNVEGLGILLEYENVNDFEGVSSENVLLEKSNMLELLKKFDLNITDEFDVKKAYELIQRRMTS